MLPEAMYQLAKGPAATWTETGLRGVTGGLMGIGAANVPFGYKMLYSPVANPEKVGDAGLCPGIRPPGPRRLCHWPEAVIR